MSKKNPTKTGFDLSLISTAYLLSFQGNFWFSDLCLGPICIQDLGIYLFLVDNAENIYSPPLVQ